MKRFALLLAVCGMLTAFSVPAYAAEYTVEAPDAGLFGQPTSDDTIYVPTGETANADRSKNAALLPPPFGSNTSNLPGSGELLTPNLVQATNAGAVSGGAAVMPPAIVGAQPGPAYTPTGYTAVTSDLCHSAGHLGTLSIPAIGLTVKVYQGTDSAALAKGAGHFPGTSIWDGNVAIAGHNRGVNHHFGKIHTLAAGDKITFTTQLGVRTYEVCSVAKIAADDLSVLNDSAGNRITLITCVMNEPAYRWCVQGVIF